VQQEEPDFSQLIHALHGKVRFVLIGGLAMVARGCAHITNDLDICYARHRDNYHAIVEAIQDLHPRLRLSEGGSLEAPFDARTFRNCINLTLKTDAGDFDLLGEAAGVDSFEGLWERGTDLELYGVPVRVASIADLIAMKRAANRGKDARHILELESLQRLLEREPYLRDAQ
jgi:hypothetical protein